MARAQQDRGEHRGPHRIETRSEIAEVHALQSRDDGVERHAQDIQRDDH